MFLLTRFGVNKIPSFTDYSIPVQFIAFFNYVIIFSLSSSVSQKMRAWQIYNMEVQKSWV